MSKKISELTAASDPTGAEKFEVTQSSTSKAMTAQQIAKATLAVTASGTDTYTAGTTPALTAYTTNDRFYVKFTNANTGAATLNIDGLGAKALKKQGTTALSSGDIAAGQIVELVYDGTNFQIVGGGGGGSGSGISGLTAGRVAIAASATSLTDDSDLTFSGSTLTATNLAISQGAITSGSYTPTLVSIANISSATPSDFNYMRVGSVVTVSGSIAITPTAGSTSTSLRMTLPISSNLAGNELNGVGHAASGSVSVTGAVYSDTTNDQAQFIFISSGTGLQSYKLIFSYLIV